MAQIEPIKKFTATCPFCGATQEIKIPYYIHSYGYASEELIECWKCGKLFKQTFVWGLKECE